MATSKAAVFVGPEKPFEVQEFPILPVEPGAVLVKMEMCGICGTDVHAWHQQSTAFPTIMGHENIGVVAELGKGVTADLLGNPLKEGDRILFRRAPCGRCMSCVLGESCRGYSGVPRLSTDPPHLRGGYSQYYYQEPPAWILRIPDDMSTERALLSVIGNHSVLSCLESLGGINLADTVVVQGSGPIGMGGLNQAKIAGAGKVIVIGAPANRLALAKEMEADEIIDIGEYSDPQSRVERVRELTNGRGADVVIECSGARTAFQEGLEMARVGGKFAVVGQYTDYGPLPINPALIARKALRLAGVSGPYLRCIVRSFQYMHNVVRSPVEKLITHRYPLDKINEGFRAHESLEAMVAVVVPNQ